MKLLGIMSLHHSPADAPLTRPCVLAASYRLCEKSFPTQTDYFFTSEKKIVCLCCRASLRLENEVADWRWNRPCKSAFIPLLHLLFFFVSFQSYSKRGSLIRGVCVSALYTCVYVGEIKGVEEDGK